MKVFITLLVFSLASAEEYRGVLVGELTSRSNDVAGKLYAADGNTFFLKDFTFDGEIETAYFYTGCRKVEGETPNTEGVRLFFEGQDTDLAVKASDASEARDYVIHVPLRRHVPMDHLGWFSLWDAEKEESLGDVAIPEGFEAPSPVRLTDVTSPGGQVTVRYVVLRTHRLITLHGFSFDGSEEANFYVGSGPSVTAAQGRLVQLASGESSVGEIKNGNMELLLPEDATVLDIKWVALTCLQCTQPLATLRLPEQNSFIIPLHLK